MIVKRVSEMDVVTAAKIRIKNIFANGVPVNLAFSGGKDSLCLAGVVEELIQAGEIDPALLTVQFIDEEAIFPCIEETVKKWRLRFLAMGARFEWYALYWDSEMFGRTTRTRAQMEVKKDYRKLCYELLRNPGDRFATKSKQKTFETYRRQFLKWEFAFDDKLYKRFYDGLLAGDPKGRTIRAIINHAAMLAAQRE